MQIQKVNTFFKFRAQIEFKELWEIFEIIYSIFKGQIKFLENYVNFGDIIISDLLLWKLLN